MSRLGGAPARRLTVPLASPRNGGISLPRPTPTVHDSTQRLDRDRISCSPFVPLLDLWRKFGGTVPPG